MNFIETYQMEDTGLCDLIIGWFEKYGVKRSGVVGSGYVDKEMKDSTDCLFDGPLTEEYGCHLAKCIDEYRKKYESCDQVVGPWSIFPFVNIQKYDPGGYYKVFHCERDAGFGKVSQRHLVFMTYLNDIADGGETEFLYQNAKVKPVKGKTLIWPVDWTHTHRGLVSNTETKYIVTGWISFTPHEQFKIISDDPNNGPRYFRS